MTVTMRYNDKAGTEPMVVSGRGVIAVLGPTNTGKTHYAIERMTAHKSGVIGLPLRLLAREVYTRIVERLGAAHVALVTGEEKISPPGARYSVCTVEAMPQETDAAFVAIDEVQLAGDLERGHVFTDRILHLRGREETLLLGSGTMRPVLERLLPGLTVVSRPRLSQLAYSGSKKLTRLPRRSAIVAFSADEVYAIAELIRRQRGGAAVVLGALSPRTRNAQVALYQQGDVEYLVATDAIGMGLNLDVDHVAFAQARKFDGFQFRNLNPAEMGQIAGRAGRHMRDGTFGVTGRVDPLADETVEKIECHDFEPVRMLQWRSKKLDFSSLDDLGRSLDAIPVLPNLTRALPAVDQQALERLVRDAEIRDLANTPERVEALWDVCSLPDYRKITPVQHSELIATIFTDLARHGCVNEDYVAEQVAMANRIDGDIDTLSARISQIRTWTYVSHRPDWLANPSHWREKTREIEDRLSDALHERLTKRFVDRRTSVLMRRLRENTMLEAEIGVDGDMFVEGHHVGQLSGFRFTPDSAAEGPDARAVLAAAQKTLALEFEARAARLHASGNSDFALGADAAVRWLGEPVAKLAASESILRPRIVLLADEQLSGQARDVVAARIERFVNHQITTILKPLEDLATAEDLEGLAKGLAFRIVENLGVLFRREVAEDVKSLDQDARGSLRRYGVRFGAYHVFMPALLKPAPAEIITLLWSLRNDGFDKPGYGDITAALAAGRTSIVTEPSYQRDFYRLGGFRYLGKRAVRIDILERLADLIRPLLQWKPGGGPLPEGAYDGRHFTTTPAMLSILGATPDDMEEILRGLGYRSDQVSAQEAASHLEALRSREQAETPKAAGDADTTPGSETPFVAEGDAAGESPADEIVAEAATDTPEPEFAEPAASAAPVTVMEADTLTAQSAPGETAEAEEEPKPVLLWRPGSRNDNQRNRHFQGKRGNQKGDGRRGDQGNRHNRKGQSQGQGQGQGKPGRKPDNGGKHEKARHNRRPPHKEKPIDPDSPFAKLAALKEQLSK